MPGYRLSYSTAEDRLLVAVDDGDRWVALTRRLTREMLKAMAKIVAQQKSQTFGRNEQVRNTVLDFERSKAVIDAYADGSAGREKRKSANPPSPKLASEIDIVGKKGGGVALVFKDRAELLTLALDIRGVYVLMATLLEISVSAGWDFPEIASWLEPASPRTQDQEPPTRVH